MPSETTITQTPFRWRGTVLRAAAGVLHQTGLLRGAQHLARTHVLERSAKLFRLRRALGSRYGILCYHRVGTEGVPLFSRLAPAVFAAQMRYLRRHYRIVSLTRLCTELEDPPPDARPTLAITFDDGYRDLYYFALPVLRKHDIPATIYLIGQCMETGEAPWYDRIFAALQSVAGIELELELDTRRRLEFDSPAARGEAAWQVVRYLCTLPDKRRREWCAEFNRKVGVAEETLQGRMLTWEQVREMQHNRVDFGAHTMTHPVVSRLDEDGLERELATAKHLLEAKLESTVGHFAYPFGKAPDCSEASQTALSRAGYRSAVTTIAGLNLPGCDPLRLHRLQVGDDASLAMFAFNVTRMFLETAAEAPKANQNAETEVMRGVNSPRDSGSV